MLKTETDKLQSSYERGGTTVSVTGVDDLPYETEVVANEMLSSVFGNLLTNAVIHNDADDHTSTSTSS